MASGAPEAVNLARRTEFPAAPPAERGGRSPDLCGRRQAGCPVQAPGVGGRGGAKCRNRPGPGPPSPASTRPAVCGAPSGGGDPPGCASGAEPEPQAAWQLHLAGRPRVLCQGQPEASVLTAAGDPLSPGPWDLPPPCPPRGLGVVQALSSLPALLPGLHRLGVLPGVGLRPAGAPPGLLAGKPTAVPVGAPAAPAAGIRAPNPSPIARRCDP